MNKVLFSFLLLSIFTANQLRSQLPVSTIPQNKKVVMEHFTGMKCGYSPDGDKIASQILANNPGNVVLIQIHQGNWAIPSAGEPDFRIPTGNAIAMMPFMGLTAYPEAAINRTIMQAYAANTIAPYGMAMSRNYWSNACNATFTQSAYCNVALQGSIDVNTRVLNVEAQVFYTGSSPAPNNSITIVLIEDSIHGPTADWGNYNPTNYNADGSYNHNRVLRAIITPTFGTSIPTTTAGTTFSTSATYTVPLLFGTGTNTNLCLLGRLSLAAFVTESNSITINAANGPIYLSGFSNSVDIGLNNPASDPLVCEGNNFASSFKFINYGSSTATSAVVGYSMNGLSIGTYTWNGSVAPFQQSQAINLPTFSFSPLPTNTLQVNVLSVNGVADQNNTNDATSKTVSQSTLMANSINMQMTFVQDQWGSESTWTVYAEQTNSIVAQDGPFTNLGAVGTATHVKSFTINPNNCYRLEVSDTYGDGINAGAGAGNYSLMAGGSNFIYCNGVFGYKNRHWFKSSITSVVSELQNENDLKIFPNPANANGDIYLQVERDMEADVFIFNSTGQLIFVSERKEFQAGKNYFLTKKESWSAGIYLVKIKQGEKEIIQKLIID